LRQTTKDKVEVNFSKGFSCTKVKLGLLSADKKKEDYVMARKNKKRKFEDGKKRIAM